MLIDAIRDDGTKEVVHSAHIARAWEESGFNISTGREFLFTHIMFSCGLVVRYSYFMIQEATEPTKSSE